MDAVRKKSPLHPLPKLATRNTATSEVSSRLAGPSAPIGRKAKGNAATSDKPNGLTVRRRHVLSRLVVEAFRRLSSCREQYFCCLPFTSAHLLP